MWRGVVKYTTFELSTCRPEFNPRNLGFVVNKVTFGEIFLQILRLSPISFVSPKLLSPSVSQTLYKHSSRQSL